MAVLILLLLLQSFSVHAGPGMAVPDAPPLDATVEAHHPGGDMSGMPGCATVLDQHGCGLNEPAADTGCCSDELHNHCQSGHCTPLMACLPAAVPGLLEGRAPHLGAPAPALLSVALPPPYQPPIML